jgi:hypothetical protein
VSDGIVASGTKHEGTEQIALAGALTEMLADHSGLGIRLREIPFSWDNDCHRLSGRFHYISFADGVPTIQEFVEYLYSCLIPYCLPRKKINDVIKNAVPTSDYPKIIRLGDDAKSLFIKAKKQLNKAGEPGEIILYALLEWSLKAPQLVSKMYLKTNSEMPVHGTDGIHLGYDEEKDLLSIYFGESKIYKDFASAAGAAFSSIIELIDKSGQISREIDILNNLSDLDALEPKFREKIIEYINPYSNSEASLNKRIVHA